MTQAERLATLRQRMAPLGSVKRLREFSLEGTGLQLVEMIAITERALELISHFYVHLPTKRTLHATDPEQSLKNLREELIRGRRSMAELEFHRRMAAIFVGLRDRHTSYVLPSAYRRTIAFLPFLIEAVGTGRDRAYIVSKVFGTFNGEFAVPANPHDDPVVITHWNGVPIARAVALNGDRNAGANPEARLARGLDRLTFRWLGMSPPPDEDWIVVSYTVGGRRHQQRFEWFGVQRPEGAAGAPAAERGKSFALGRDAEGEWIRQVKEALFAQPEKWQTHGSGRRLAYRRHPRDGGRNGYGYLRIYTFDVELRRIDAFVASVRRILRRAPARGLIIDVRGNPGGQIPAAERLLPLFSPGAVDFEGLQFRNTSQVATLAANFFADSPKEFQERLNEAWTTGAPYISSLPAFSDDSPVPDQVYQGPVVVIVSANCYSAAEIFAAGMQDNALATIMGTAGQTGGGGANVWEQDLIWRVYREGKTPARLPQGASFNVAIRRTTRVRDLAGVALEDLGVIVPQTNVKALTPADVLGDNEDLLAAAAQLLDAKQRHRIRASFDGRRTFTLSTTGLDRVDVFVDGVPVGSESPPNGKKIDLRGRAPRPTTALFLGYAEERQPVTSFRWMAPRAQG
jgi:C-terminal processing protease CtpA/Prc